MKLMVVCPYFYPRIGGLENYSYNISKLEFFCSRDCLDTKWKEYHTIGGIGVFAFQRPHFVPVGFASKYIENRQNENGRRNLAELNLQEDN